VSDAFHRFAVRASGALGSSRFFAFNVAATAAWVAAWAVRGWDDWWQLFCTTLLTVTTWLLLILVQHTQDTNQVAMQRKLDELIRATERARNELIGVEHAEETPPDR
jgi:low affinity Fe/Cu permease